ncbi:MAG: cupin domain-containing protein [Alphaproteobacteria bacterium]|jgi:quercetin dioxygenase-like cupin family protein
MSHHELQVFDSTTMPWEERFVPQLGKALFAKAFLEDPDTGVTVRMVKYPAGFMNAWHTHPCAHGMFVLEGTLVTHKGNFAPGNFIWFPQGMRMEHGATQTEDVTVLFITNKKFEIWYEKSVGA